MEVIVMFDQQNIYTVYTHMEIYMLDLKECVCKYTVVAKSDLF